MVSNVARLDSGASLEPIPLCQLRPGDRGRLRGANLCGDDCELLRAMGMNEHSEIRVCRTGEPCIIQVNATRLGLSSLIAREILVETSIPRA